MFEGYLVAFATTLIFYGPLNFKEFEDLSKDCYVPIIRSVAFWIYNILHGLLGCASLFLIISLGIEVSIGEEGSSQGTNNICIQGFIAGLSYSSVITWIFSTASVVGKRINSDTLDLQKNVVHNLFHGLINDDVNRYFDKNIDKIFSIKLPGPDVISSYFLYNENSNIKEVGWAMEIIEDINNRSNNSPTIEDSKIRENAIKKFIIKKAICKFGKNGAKRHFIEISKL